MLELNINNGKLVVQDSGEMTYSNLEGNIADIESILKVEETENK